MFNHQHHEDFLVGVGVIRRGIGVEVGRVQLAADGTLAQRLVARGADRRLGFRPRINHRDDNAVSACVEDAFDVFAGVPGHARQRHASASGDDCETLGGRFKVHRGVFQLDGEPVKAHARHQARRHWIRQGQPGPDGRLAAFQFRSSVIRFHKSLNRSRRFPSPSPQGRYVFSVGFRESVFQGYWHGRLARVSVTRFARAGRPCHYTGNAVAAAFRFPQHVPGA